MVDSTPPITHKPHGIPDDHKSEGSKGSGAVSGSGFGAPFASMQFTNAEKARFWGQMCQDMISTIKKDIAKTKQANEELKKAIEE